MSLAHKPTALLDACVLYPAPMRDLLLHCADVGLYVPKWTANIHDEWVRNLLTNRPDLSAERLRKTCEAMDNAFPDAPVIAYESLIDLIDLPDPDDQFVFDHLEANPGQVKSAFWAQVANLRNPPKTSNEVLDLFREIGLIKTANQLTDLLTA